MKPLSLFAKTAKTLAPFVLGSALFPAAGCHITIDEDVLDDLITIEVTDDDDDDDKPSEGEGEGEEKPGEGEGEGEEPKGECDEIAEAASSSSDPELSAELWSLYEQCVN